MSPVAIRTVSIHTAFTFAVCELSTVAIPLHSLPSTQLSLQVPLWQYGLSPSSQVLHYSVNNALHPLSQAPLPTVSRTAFTVFASHPPSQALHSVKYALHSLSSIHSAVSITHCIGLRPPQMVASSSWRLLRILRGFLYSTIIQYTVCGVFYTILYGGVFFMRLLCNVTTMAASVQCNNLNKHSTLDLLSLLHTPLSLVFLHHSSLLFLDIPEEERTACHAIWNLRKFLCGNNSVGGRVHGTAQGMTLGFEFSCQSISRVRLVRLFFGQSIVGFASLQSRPFKNQRAKTLRSINSRLCILLQSRLFKNQKHSQ